MRAVSEERAALAVGLLAALVFVVLAVLVMTPFGIALDGALLGGVQRTATPPVVAAMGLLTRLGNEFIIVALPLVLLWLWRRRLRQQAVEVLIATLGAQLLNDALKLVFHRPRPSGFVSVIPGQAFSFPSGHAMVSIAFYGALAVIGWRVLRGRARIAWLTTMTAVVFLVGVSRLFLDVHYPTDVLASWAGGLFWLDITLALVRTVVARRAAATHRRLRPNPIGGPPCSNAR
jgi:membrane-associated phospholipid phosphatase